MNHITTPLPLVETRLVRKAPRRISFEGRPYVVWKTGEGFFASSAVCPHRGADLSKGKACEKFLRCPYHGWTIAGDGKVTSPSEGKAKGHQQTFPLTDRFGFLWLGGDAAYFAELERERGDFLGALTVTLKAPLHITLDSFVDGTHLPFVHRRNALFEPTGDLQFSWSEDDTSVTITSDYPQRRFSLIGFLNFFVPFRWVVSPTVDFAPVRIRYQNYWYRASDKKVPNGVNTNTFYLYPADRETTVVPCLLFHRLPKHLRPFRRLFAAVSKRLLLSVLTEDVEVAQSMLVRKLDRGGLRLEAADVPLVRVRERYLRSREFAGDD